jgi:hypothetical protein
LGIHTSTNISCFVVDETIRKHEVITCKTYYSYSEKEDHGRFKDISGLPHVETG